MPPNVSFYRERTDKCIRHATAWGSARQQQAWSGWRPTDGAYHWPAPHTVLTASDVLAHPFGQRPRLLQDRREPRMPTQRLDEQTVRGDERHRCESLLHCQREHVESAAPPHRAVTRLVAGDPGARGQSRVGRELRRRAETSDRTDLRLQQERAERSDAGIVCRRLAVSSRRTVALMCLSMR